MQRTRIKICGICRPEDALTAAQAGADAVGMVLDSRSGRYVIADLAKQILAAIPPFVTPVGLFVDADAKTVAESARTLRLRHIQLHGEETPATVRALSDFIILKAIRVERDQFQAELNRWRGEIAQGGLSHLRGLLLESPRGADGRPGGTGRENDWETIASAVRDGAFAGLPPIIAAGGLTPLNVAQVVRSIRPWAVDVSSGVEESLGRKSPGKIEAFINAVAQAAGERPERRDSK